MGSNATTVTCTPSVEGTLTVTVQVTDADGAQRRSSPPVQVTVVSTPKLATNSALSGTEGLAEVVLGIAVTALLLGLVALFFRTRHVRGAPAEPPASDELTAGRRPGEKEGREGQASSAEEDLGT